MLDSDLYRQTLASTSSALHRSSTEKLNAALLDCREKAAVIASKIPQDLPDFTVHDVTHADALWEMADIIVGPDFSMNPLEAFVFGVSALIHDLALTKTALPGDFAETVGRQRWRDSVFAHVKLHTGREPTTAELDDPSSYIVASAERELLREHHAEQASRLPQQTYKASGGPDFHLISDPVLRGSHGELIGRIAASHWWNLEQLSAEFDTLIGAPAQFPREWTIDPLKIACLLRVADIAHIDSRRAPAFLRAITKVSPASTPHWVFQERMQRPWVDGDRLQYTASQPFGPAEAEAWWLCADTLRAIDRELRDCDTLLADTDRPRFVVRAVGYVDDLPRLAKLVPVRDWYPIDAQVRVGNVIDLVRRLGGDQLYGDDPRAAFRELVSNGCDAVRARRAIQGAAVGELRLRVQVELQDIDEKLVRLTVRDNGIGMSREVMGGALLDFGTSYWSSSEARRDLPGLLSSGFRPTGKFGIGFFSVFMLGERVKVTSRRFDHAVTDAYSIEFSRGLQSRPLLQRVMVPGLLPYGGSEVSVDIDRAIIGKLLADGGEAGRADTLRALCGFLFPVSDVNIEAVGPDGADRAVNENDWLTIEPAALFERLYQRPRRIGQDVLARLSPVTDPQGNVLGRAAVLAQTADTFSRHPVTSAPVCVDGARSGSIVSRVVGIFQGSTTRAARDSATPLAGERDVARWADGQLAAILAQEPLPPEEQKLVAETLHALGAEVEGLVVAMTRDGYVTLSELASWVRDRTSIRLLFDAAYSNACSQYGEKILLDDDVVSTDFGHPSLLQTPARNGIHRFDPSWAWPTGRWLVPSLVEVCLARVERAWGDETVMQQYDDAVRAKQRREQDLEDSGSDSLDDPNENSEHWGTRLSGSPVEDTGLYVVRRSSLAAGDV